MEAGIWQQTDVLAMLSIKLWFDDWTRLTVLAFSHFCSAEEHLFFCFLKVVNVGRSSILDDNFFGHYICTYC